MWFTLSLLAAAQVPSPPTPDCGPENPDACPSDFGSRAHLSWIPDDSIETVRAAEIPLGSGIGLDVALRTTLGDFGAPVAILDSGVEWDQRRLYEKIWLNEAELPLPLNAEGLAVRDADGNGIFNLSDYRWDPRVLIDAGNDEADDRLDPSDLLAVFSDGVDDDSNGFIDDIAGWDFYGNDNDPYAVLDNSFSGHGTGMALDAADPAGNGGGVGTCPNCAVIPVRVGDTFIVDGDRVAQGIRYAVDRGAVAINMALGSLTHPEGAREAVRYAMDSDVIVVAAGGDENGYHHNVPGLDDGILYVRSVTSDNRGSDGAYSYFNSWNCNNFGPRIDLVASSSACASGASSATTGSAALLISAGRSQGVDLSGDEVRALLLGTVDDVSLTQAEREISQAYPSKDGWDAFYGAGRLDIGNAVEAVVAGDIPPEVHFDAPRWFAWPDRGEDVDVVGFVDAPRSGSLSWTLELGRGAEPDSWQSVASGVTPISGVLATLSPQDFDAAPVQDLDDEGVSDRMYRAHEPMVTARLTATDAEGISAVTRRSFWMHRDSDLLPGWPFDVGGSLEASAILADFNDDAVYEVVLVSGGGTVRVVDGAGTLLAGFPVYTPEIAGSAGLHEGVVGTPAVGDIDGDGSVEVIVSTLGGSVMAWHSDGSEVAGFPVRMVGRTPEEFVAGAAYDNSIAGAPTLGDVDGDGVLEIIQSANDQRLYVWNGDGTLFDGYPIELCKDYCGFRAIASVSVGDIDGDGDLDVAVPTNEIPNGGAGTLWLIDLQTATPLDGWPRARPGLLNTTILPVFGEGHPSPVGLVDLDDDGDLELITSAMLGAPEVLNHDGSVFHALPGAADRFGDDSNLRDSALNTFAGHPGIGDMNGDGVRDIILGGGTPSFLISLAATREVEFDHAVGGWSGADGAFLPGWPRQNDDVAFLHAPGIADIDGDGLVEALYGSSGFFMNAWNADGDVPAGWPKNVGGWIIGSPAIGDITGDGALEVLVTVRNGYVFAFSTTGSADQDVQWPMNHHDAFNSGNAHVPLLQQAGIPPTIDDEETGCSCQSGPSSALGGFAFLALVLIRRRRLKS